jgi:hypothetical protein
LKPGAVFRWKEFPYPKYAGEIKARWFIYLGDTGLLLAPVIAHICTTTTSLDDFGPRRKRTSHRHLLLKKTRYPFFDEDCILDFDEGPYPVEKKSLENNPDIEIKGELDQECLKMIYYGIWKSSFYSPKIVLDIHTSLNQAGITGLRKP